MEPRLANRTYEGRRAQHAPSLARLAGFTASLLSGGDCRVAIDPHTGTNKYACPPLPAPGIMCFSSCTASPISQRGFEKAAECYDFITGASSPRERASRLGDYHRGIERGLLRYFGVAGLADVILCPSGTDALLTATVLLASERPTEAMTAILPAASETGTGVPLAAAGRRFDGPGAGTPIVGCAIDTVEIPLRTADGAPRSEDEVNGAFVAAAKAARGRPVIYLTHGSKTGLIAPTELPAGFDVIVDACQARIDPACVAAYLRRGWPVAVTGSKFFGGPAFSGAVLFPTARMRSIAPNPDTGRERSDLDTDRFGMVLRWIAAIDTIEMFAPLGGSVAGALRNRAQVVDLALRSIPALAPIAGLRASGPGWADQPSIFTFGVGNIAEPRRLLSAAELRPLYDRLARAGILLGQPVDLGSFGGLRIAIGARDLIDGSEADGLDRMFDALAEATEATPSWRRSAATACC